MPSLSTGERPTQRYIAFINGPCCRLLLAVLVSFLYAVLLHFSNWSHALAVFSIAFLGLAAVYYFCFICYRLYTTCVKSANNGSVPRYLIPVPESLRKEGVNGSALAVLFWLGCRYSGSCGESQSI